MNQAVAAAGGRWRPCRAAAKSSCQNGYGQIEWSRREPQEQILHLITIKSRETRETITLDHSQKKKLGVPGENG
jgi:hypothetical protein